eukprot:Opistho-2@78365
MDGAGRRASSFIDAFSLSFGNDKNGASGSQNNNRLSVSLNAGGSGANSPIQRSPSGSKKKNSESRDEQWLPLYRQQANKEGFLLKLGREGGFLPSKFERRYFILHRSNLFYFRKKEEDQPVGVIQLRGASVSRDPQSQPGKPLITINSLTSVNFESQKCFSKRPYTFIAESEDDAVQWIAYLQSAVATAAAEGSISRSQSSDTLAVPDDNESRSRSSTNQSRVSARTDSVGSAGHEEQLQASSNSFGASGRIGTGSAPGSRGGSPMQSRSGSQSDLMKGG